MPVSWRHSNGKTLGGGGLKNSKVGYFWTGLAPMHHTYIPEPHQFLFSGETKDVFPGVRYSYGVPVLVYLVHWWLNPTQRNYPTGITATIFALPSNSLDSPLSMMLLLFSHDTPWCSLDASWYLFDAPLMITWYSFDAILMLLWCHLDAPLILFWCLFDPSLIFFDAIMQQRSIFSIQYEHHISIQYEP